MGAPKGNKYALGNTGGKPPKYKTAAEMEKEINLYFESCKPEYDDNGNLIAANYPTLTGLALFLGFCDKSSLWQYRDRNKEFVYPIKRALSIIENHYESQLNSKASTGAIFALKNFQWKDKTETDITSNGESLNLSDSDREKRIADLLKKASK